VSRAVPSGEKAAPQPYDAAEEARKMRQEIAKQARFDIKNFPNLRTADDFARGAILNKSKIKEVCCGRTLLHTTTHTKHTLKTH
jgi:hypothetical protein